MSYRLSLLPVRARILLGASLALALSGCSYDYEYREFDSLTQKEAWGEMFMGWRTQGSWYEGGLSVSGTPYALTFAPRVVERPAPDCRFHIGDLRISSEATQLPLLEVSRVDLDAGPPQPDEPNNQPYSPYFHYVPLEKAYLASGHLERIDLPFEPLRVTFYLQGNSTCPTIFRSPVRYDIVLKPWTSKGTTGVLPAV
ncbi:MAG: hypothetical protein V4466_17260 [Pseudomonadota bacterium]